MIKQDAVLALGEAALVRPARLREALKANDRLKLELTVLQAAAAHAAAPSQRALDLAQDIAAAGIHDRELAAWLRELPARAEQVAGALNLPDFPRLAGLLAADLATMAKPLVEETTPSESSWQERLGHWQARLQAMGAAPIEAAALADLTRGRREGGDSLHLLVMDMHRAINQLAAQLEGQDIAGAHAWGLAVDGTDRRCIEAFMRGLARTRHLKGTHPGLDTSATRDGDRLLIQNDIGTNDAHVLVLQVEGLSLSLTYSDLHRSRFIFFQRVLSEAGAQWTAVATHQQAALNQGEAYQVGTARWQASDEAGLLEALEAVGARVVFLIDWNRARKRLQQFVDKGDAVQILHEACRRECGHMAWLTAGAERLVWDAMAAQGGSRFRLGDRLCDVLGADAARSWLIELLVLAADGAAAGRPPAWLADEARLRLAPLLRLQGGAASALAEHASWCHALAQGLRDALAHGAAHDARAASSLAQRAKVWERRADELVEQSRRRAERHPAAQAEAALMHAADDVADSLEEACFLLSLAAESRPKGWGAESLQALQALADAVLVAVQEHVKATLTLQGASPSATPCAPSHNDALDALWLVVQAERQCDELLRSARRALALECTDAVALALGTELACALEAASDHLLAVGHALRQRTLSELT